MGARNRFFVGQKVTFKGKIGIYSTNLPPEETKGIITKIEEDQIRIGILNNDCFTRYDETQYDYTFRENTYDTILIIEQEGENVT